MSETAMDLKGAQHGGDPKTVTTTATSFGPVALKGRYEVSVTGIDASFVKIYFKPATSQAAAEAVTSTGSTRGKTIWDGNTAEIMLDENDWVGVITSAGSAEVSLDYMRSY